MTLVLNGAISMGDINVELGRPRATTISLDAAENGSYVAIRVAASPKPSATNPATISKWYGYQHISTVDTTPPTTPSLGVINNGPGYLYFEWSASTDASGIQHYQIWRSVDSSALSMYDTTVDIFYYDYGVISGSGSGHSYRIRAVDNAGNISDFSNVSSAFYLG